MSQPAFWFRRSSPISTALLPLAWIWQCGHKLNTILRPRKTIGIPVISVGNLNIGGTGKTPLTISLVQKLIEQGHTPHIVSRGYGGYIDGPVQVNRYLNLVSEVGDEPLLLMEFAPTWVAKNRYKGALEAQKHGASIVILDDGHQNRHLVPSFSIIIVDNLLGFGNERVIPSGPLREPVKSGLARANCILVSKDHQDLSAFAKKLPTLAECPLFCATLKPLAQGLDLNQSKVVAFAGIGNPFKFKRTLIQLGVDLIEFLPLNDHQVPSESLLRRIERKAKRNDALIVTTEKDAVRLSDKWKSRVLTIPVRLEIHDWNELKQLIHHAISSESNLTTN